MKKIFLFILLLNFTVFSQENIFFIGVSSTYNFPTGQLGKRLNGNLGFLLYLGKPVSDDWTWVGKLEYFKLTDVNKNEMKKFIKSDLLGSVRTFEFPLTNIEMNLTAVGLTAEAKYRIFRTSFFDTDFNLGFGFFFWEFFRNSYMDSLFVDSTGNGDFVLVEALNVPSLRQKDWSGSVNFGTEFNVNFFDPLSINLAINYKLIIAELWPSLALNLENVSGLQFIDIRAGVKYEF